MLINLSNYAGECRLTLDFPKGSETREWVALLSEGSQMHQGYLILMRRCLNRKKKKKNLINHHLHTFQKGEEVTE